MILVAVHGHPLDRRMWLPLGGALGDAVKLFAPDLRGRGTARRHASQTHPMPLFAHDVAFDIEDLLDENEPLILCGHSMGGYVVLELLRRHGRALQSRVAGLILCDTTAAADDPARIERRKAAVGAIAVLGMGPIPSAMLPSLLSPHTLHGEFGPALEQLTRTMILETPAETACADLVGMAMREATIDVLETVSVPTLLVHGEDDLVTPPSEGEAMAKALTKSPRVLFQTVSGAGHLAPLERPREVAEAVKELLRRL